MALTLKDIGSTVTDKPRKVVVYGIHGVGKSTFAAGADNPVFLPTEDGLGTIAANAFPLLRSFSEVIEAMIAVCTEQHDYKTIVVDTLDWLETLIFDEVCGAEKTTNIEKIGYAKGYKFALNHWKRFLAGLDKIRTTRGMDVILLAHAKSSKVEMPGESSVDKYTLKLDTRAHSLVSEWCDELLFATYPTVSNPHRVKVKDDPVRVLMTSESPIYEAKNRLHLPPQIEMTWADYDHYRRKEMARLATPTTEAQNGQSE